MNKHFIWGEELRKNFQVDLFMKVIMRNYVSLLLRNFVRNSFFLVYLCMCVFFYFIFFLFSKFLKENIAKCRQLSWKVRHKKEDLYYISFIKIKSFRMALSRSLSRWPWWVPGTSPSAPWPSPSESARSLYSSETSTPSLRYSGTEISRILR